MLFYKCFKFYLFYYFIILPILFEKKIINVFVIIKWLKGTLYLVEISCIEGILFPNISKYDNKIHKAL